MYAKDTVCIKFSIKISNYFLIFIYIFFQLMPENTYKIATPDFLKGGIKLSGEIQPQL